MTGKINISKWIAVCLGILLIGVFTSITTVRVWEQNKETRNYLNDELAKQQAFTVDLIDVSTDKLTNGQNILLQLSTKDINSANMYLPTYIPALRKLIDAANMEKGTKIALCRMRLLDENGAILLNYVWDAETREETSSSVEGLVPWYPHPEEVVKTPEVEPEPYPAPSIEIVPTASPDTSKAYPIP